MSPFIYATVSGGMDIVVSELRNRRRKHNNDNLAKLNSEQQNILPSSGDVNWERRKADYIYSNLNHSIQ